MSSICINMSTCSHYAGLVYMTAFFSLHGLAFPTFIDNTLLTDTLSSGFYSLSILSFVLFSGLAIWGALQTLSIGFEHPQPVVFCIFDYSWIYATISICCKKKASLMGVRVTLICGYKVKYLECSWEIYWVS